MIKRITKLGWVTIILIIFFSVIGLSHLTESKPKSAADQLQRETDILPKEQIPSMYPDIQLFIENDETDLYRMSVETHVTESNTINENIKQWVTDQKNDFKDDVDDNQYEEKHPNLHLALTLEKVTDRYYQIHYTKEINGSVHFTKTFNVDLDNEQMLSLDDIFKMNDNTRDTLAELARENKGETNIPDEQLEDMLDNPEQWDWDINRDVFSLHMDIPDEKESGKHPVSIDIPLDSLYLSFSDQIADIIDMSDEQQQAMANAIQAEKERIAREKKRKENLKAKASAKQEARAKKVADPNGKYIALTFDDGPSADVSARILVTLAEHDAVATFFMLGTEVDTYPDIAKQVADAGHEIGNHTKNHKNLTKLEPYDIRNEIGYTSDRIQEVTGKRPYLVRSPYGAYNDTVLQDIERNKNSLALWSVDSLEWKTRDKNAIYKEVTEHMTSGSIVLMHDIHPATADALPSLLTALKKEGYQFV